MKTRIFLAIVLLIALGTIQSPSLYAQFGDFFKDLKKVLESEELSESKITQGLKEALQIGTSNAVNTVSKVDGYYKNPKIRIPLPNVVQKTEKVLGAVGYGPQLDTFKLSMNRAAEQAAPEAKSLFLDAIKQMTFSDARKILQGRDNEATLYFKDKTYNPLRNIFKPIVYTAMSKVGVTNTYQELEAKVRSMPLTERWSLSLDDYVTDKALDGLFLMVAEEERKIRQDPTARVTDVLKEVFGSRSR
jgi:hypothetical protein